LANIAFQALHLVILVAALTWVGYALVKLIGPMLTPNNDSRRRANLRVIAGWGVVLLGLVLLDQFLLGRFR
jgi:hypothetical protein